MNLHGLVSGVVGTVNPPTSGYIRRSTGYATAASGKRTPAYAAAFGPVTMQVQPLSTKQIEHVDSLNLQGVFRSIYINGEVTAVDRQTQTGGDLVLFDRSTWLVVEVTEAWTQSGWTRAIVSKQSV